MPSHTSTPPLRALRLAAMTIGVTGSYAGYLLQRLFLGEERREEALKSTHARAARRVREEMQTLRGPIMKLGQALSMHTDVLPEEVFAELAKLQMEAPAMHESLAQAQFKRSMGRYPDEVFRSFEPQPFAAASLGQVHRAVTEDGQRVAVKIQYPGIRTAVESDFRWARAASTPARASGHVTAAMIDEIECQILAETDYGREADNIEFFRRRLARLDFVSVPRAFRELSTDQVLTMSLVPGRHLESFLSTKPSQRLRDRVGARLFELFYFQLLSVEAFHADPHWGNYLFNDDGTVGLVDFGCVKFLDTPWVDNLRRLYLYPGRCDSEEFQRLIAERYMATRGAIDAATRRALTDFSERFYRKVYPPEPDKQHQPFDFGNAAFLRDYTREASKIMRTKGMLPEYIFYARAEMGLYNTLYRLRARVPTSLIVSKYMSPLSV